MSNPFVVAPIGQNPINDSIWRALRSSGTYSMPYAVWFANYRHRHEFEIEEIVDEEGNEPTVILVIGRAYKQKLEGIDAVKESGPTGVDAHSQAGDGEAVGGGDTEGKEVAEVCESASQPPVLDQSGREWMFDLRQIEGPTSH